MAHLTGTADDVAARVPAVAETYGYVRDNVLLSGLVDRRLKELCFRFLADDSDATDFSRYDGRELAALEWAFAIAWDSDRADDELWERLHSYFSEEELVELGCAIGFELGRTHWLRTLGVEPGLPHAPSS